MNYYCLSIEIFTRIFISALIGGGIGAILAWIWIRRKEAQAEKNHKEYMAEVKKLTKLWDNCKRTDCENHKRVIDSLNG